MLCIHRSRGPQKRFDLIAQAMDEKLVHDTHKREMVLCEDELHLASLLKVKVGKATLDKTIAFCSAINRQPSNSSPFISDNTQKDSFLNADSYICNFETILRNPSTFLFQPNHPTLSTLKYTPTSSPKDLKPA